MLRVISALLGLALLLVIGAAVVMMLLRDSSPSLQPMPEISAEQREWGKRLLHQGLLEGVGARGEAITLTPADLDILSVLLTEQIIDSRLQIVPGDDSAQVSVALRLPAELGGWLNVRALLVAPAGVLAFQHVEVGQLPVPAALAELALQQVLAALQIPALPGGIEFSPQAIRLGTNPTLTGGPDQFSAVLGGDETARVLTAQRRLAQLSVLSTDRRWIDAAELLSALIAAVPADAADPVAENRAAIIALAAYVNGRSLPDPSGAPPPRWIPVRMHGRVDIPQHFFTSGALVLQSGRGVANLIGLAKELDDAKTSSGFNFSDLAANRAGNRFAELATAGPSEARRIQQMARAGLSEADIMPAVDWLPETMSQATFQRDFGGRDTPAYRIVVDEIDRRIDALPVTAIGAG